MKSQELQYMYVGLARFNNDASNMEAKGARSKQASNEKAASTSPTCHLADHSSQCAMARAALQNFEHATPSWLSLIATCT